jgi:L-iditol 2-dehydrogenase
MYRHNDYVEAIRLVKEKRVNLEPLISKIFPFQAYLDAYKFIETNREQCLKVLIDVQNLEPVLNKPL